MPPKLLTSHSPVPYFPRVPQIPVEVIERIIQEFISSRPVIGPDRTNCTDVLSLHHSCITRLLDLRLVARSWDIAILPVVFDRLRLTRNEMTHSLTRTWNEFYITPGLPRLRHLYLDGLYHSQPPSQSPTNETTTNLPPSHVFSISPENAASIISLCRRTLIQLKLRFTGHVGFVPVLRSALQLATGLRALQIESSACRGTMHDLQTIKLALETTSLLKSLSLKLSPLPSMNLNHDSLPHLRHFWLDCDLGNIDVGIDIFRSSVRRISCLELFTHGECDAAGLITLELKASLKVLFIISIPDRVPAALQSTTFPKLRVLRSEYCHPIHWDLAWLEWPLLRTIEVFVTSYWHGSVYWRSILSLTTLPIYKWPQKLKHIICVIPENTTMYDLDLVAMFEKVKVQCHFIVQPTETDLQRTCCKIEDESHCTRLIVGANAKVVIIDVDIEVMLSVSGSAKAQIHSNAERAKAMIKNSTSFLPDITSYQSSKSKAYERHTVASAKLNHFTKCNTGLAYKYHPSSKPKPETRPQLLSITVVTVFVPKPVNAPFKSPVAPAVPTAVTGAPPADFPQAPPSPSGSDYVGPPATSTGSKKRPNTAATKPRAQARPPRRTSSSSTLDLTTQE
ncbi:uncharacterized protein MELLADRAFT_104908 [Melampsora larici-populina 98AG31]|uniref:Uncharacterized protein n=1 Tax=Melampsora larici-populina (strain 98AG31 / pathotype 3-4-7) TaxID=747676 RepID=F4RGH4_MELLP|nr:uncharacterized protein MELLADRAFT_104908 [Melampsora larici-populina 98AG31]EGG08506.1 hypothetical protein MELLADRAFT_104908 [Melampsora larici-populina 98AG31]